MLESIKWAGTASSILGAFVVAVGLPLPGYLLFVFGCVAWGIAALYSKDKAQLTMQAAFLCANIIGLSRVLLNWS